MKKKGGGWVELVEKGRELYGILFFSWIEFAMKTYSRLPFLFNLLRGILMYILLVVPFSFDFFLTCWYYLKISLIWKKKHMKPFRTKVQPFVLKEGVSKKKGFFSVLRNQLGWLRGGFRMKVLKMFYLFRVNIISFAIGCLECFFPFLYKLEKKIQKIKAFILGWIYFFFNLFLSLKWKVSVIVVKMYNFVKIVFFKSLFFFLDSFFGLMEISLGYFLSGWNNSKLLIPRLEVFFSRLVPLEIRNKIKLVLGKLPPNFFFHFVLKKIYNQYNFILGQRLKFKKRSLKLSSEKFKFPKEPIYYVNSTVNFSVIAFCSDFVSKLYEQKCVFEKEKVGSFINDTVEHKLCQQNYLAFVKENKNFVKRLMNRKFWLIEKKKEEFFSSLEWMTDYIYILLFPLRLFVLLTVEFFIFIVSSSWFRDGWYLIALYLALIVGLFFFLLELCFFLVGKFLDFLLWLGRIVKAVYLVSKEKKR